MIVADTNVVAYLVLPSPHTAAAERLVADSSCPAYDCEFVALARNLDIPLATLDRKLARAFPETVVLLDTTQDTP